MNVETLNFLFCITNRLPSFPKSNSVEPSLYGPAGSKGIRQGGDNMAAGLLILGWQGGSPQASCISVDGRKDSCTATSLFHQLRFDRTWNEFEGSSTTVKTVSVITPPIELLMASDVGLVIDLL
jgi:hypothetical protein